MNKFIAAVTQATSVALDRTRTLQKLNELAARAAARGARLALFPEAFVSAYPRRSGRKAGRDGAAPPLARFLVALLVHAWIGLRDVMPEYINSVPLHLEGLTLVARLRSLLARSWPRSTA